MKYYIYISDSKVDMLLSQIPHDQKKKIATEFKIDLKLLSASRKAETEDESNRFTRLEAVTAFIREYGNVGSVDEPDEYIKGDLLMHWGPYINVYDYSGDESPLVYFGGSTERTIVGLGGSSKHVIGAGGQSSSHSHSITPFLISYLEKQLGLKKKPNPDVIDVKLHERRFFGKSLTEQERVDESLHAVYLATSQMMGPQQRLEFLAKRLLYGTYRHAEKQILLATPIYVAMAE
jgi:hypothetical protein